MIAIKGRSSNRLMRDFRTLNRWMQKFVEHEIADKRLVRLLMKWLQAGVMEDGELRVRIRNNRGARR